MQRSKWVKVKALWAFAAKTLPMFNSTAPRLQLSPHALVDKTIFVQIQVSLFFTHLTCSGEGEGLCPGFKYEVAGGRQLLQLWIWSQPWSGPGVRVGATVAVPLPSSLSSSFPLSSPIPPPLLYSLFIIVALLWNMDIPVSSTFHRFHRH